MHDRSMILSIALQGEIPEGQLSPENISTVALYHLHYNLWDTLITSDQSAAVAKSFRVSPDNLTFSFEIETAAKFSNGRPPVPASTGGQSTRPNGQSARIDSFCVIDSVSSKNNGTAKLLW